MKKINLNELEVYQLSINPDADAFVSAVALVDTPAHESMYLAFNGDQYQKQIFQVDEVKQQVLGAAIIPNKLILRKPNEAVNDWHFVKFSATDIEVMAKEFYKNNFHSNINIGHNKDEIVKGYFFQSILIGDDAGQGRVNGLELPSGTWVLGAYIEDKEVFETVSKYGFSVEGYFRYSEPTNNLKSQFKSELNTLLDHLSKF